ncbi:bifunctional nuclease family protein [Actinomycetospora straminea]|nr:bifunctional nuclease domain-containing protein [Actinomycetospora straminea]MDD7935027.1 DUF151 domain-containing protein [Actinomycetospora straminea]
MRVARLVVHRMTREPLALLVEEGADRCLVVSVRGPQAEIIDRGPRPAEPSDDDRLTQDLLGELAVLVGHRLDHGAITDLVDDRFRAELVLEDGSRLPARPSDVLAVAVREALPIEVADAVLDAVGQSFSELGGDRPEPAREAAEQVAELRAFLDQATAQDFGRPPDGGEGR